MQKTIYLHHFYDDYSRLDNEIVTKLIEKHQFTLIDKEGSLLFDETVDGTELANQIQEHNRKVIALEVEGSGEYPPELVLGTIERKITYDKTFKGFLFFRYPSKVYLWQLLDKFLHRHNNLIPSMFLITPFDSLEQLEKQVTQWKEEHTVHYDSEKLSLVYTYWDYRKPLIDYFQDKNRFYIINSADKSSNQIFEEIDQIMENL